MLNGLDLFSGIGGITFGLSEWVRPIAYCEIERYAQGVLLSRMESGDIPIAPIWDDVKTLNGKQFRNGVDIVYGGFPCQDISVAGNGAGLEGERSGLFFEIMRLVDEIRPPFIFLENVSAITTRGLRTVSSEITKRGYDSRWITLSAAQVGAPHIRRRWWLLAYSNSKRQLQPEGRKQNQRRRVSDRDWWAIESSVGRVANGIPYRLDRIKGLGNAVVPQCARKAFRILMGLEAR